MVNKNRKNQPSYFLGRALIKKKYRANEDAEFSQRHTDDPTQVKSITENTSLEEFLSKTQFENKQFEAEREANITLVTDDEPSQRNSAFTTEELEHELLIPRRPKFEPGRITAEQLKQLENESYLRWRRKLADLQERDGGAIVLTPFEKNLDFWRQLWRVIERSDVLVQILDARNPLLFYCEDLHRYIEEVDPNKVSLILLNKSDYLSDDQRKHWLRHFRRIHKRCIFFSALEQQAKIDQAENDGEDEIPEMENLNLQDEEEEEENAACRSLGYRELISYLKSLNKQPDEDGGEKKVVVGFVGYPNVGKSSTINALLRSNRRVSVSATPGKTKHFQTMILDDRMTICDCPGLVFPNVVSNKAEMIINGIMPIDQMKSAALTAVAAITSKVPTYVFETLYGITLKKKSNANDDDDNTTNANGGDPDADPTSSSQVLALELLTVYGYSRGYMTQRGLPDTSRAAKMILKDFVTGRILYCYAPPGVSQNEYHQFYRVAVGDKPSEPKQLYDRKLDRMYEGNNLLSKDFDREFFSRPISMAHVQDPRLPTTTSGAINKNSSAKPWRINSGAKRNKREKLRRVYAHLDN